MSLIFSHLPLKVSLKPSMVLSVICVIAISFASLFYSKEVQANSDDFPKVLLDAEALTSVAPQQAKNYTRQYLNSSQSESQSTSDSNNDLLSKSDDVNQYFHNQIFAYKILAKAEYQIGDYHASLSNIDKSIALAQKYRFQIAFIDASLLKAQLVWAMTEDVERTKKILEPLDQAISALPNNDIATSNRFEFLLIKGELAVEFGDPDSAQLLFDEALTLIPESTASEQSIRLNIEYAKLHLVNQKFNSALKALLESYWSAIELDLGALLAEVNTLLAELYYGRGLYTNAQDHLSQAASFYGKYEHSIYFASVVKQLADVYYIQGKYNLALVQYFNVLDHEMAERDIESIIAIRLKLARTYLQLYNFPLAEQYLQRASELLIFSDTPQYFPEALFLQAKLAFALTEYDNAVDFGEAALEASKSKQDEEIRLETLNLLAKAYIELGEQELATVRLLEHKNLSATKLNQWIAQNSKAFLNQINSVEQSIHYRSQVNELTEMHQRYDKFQKSSYILAIMVFILLVVCALFYMLLRKSKRREQNISDELYTHTRSGLQNLKMMNISLRTSLKQSRTAMEQWEMGELINEPLNDRLRFAMVELPFLTDMYIKEGYHIGLKVEKAFGQHVQEQLSSSARLYHFFDSMFLYIEPNTDPNSDPQELFERIQDWVDTFKTSTPIDTHIRVGLADYPFLPRAYTAINDKELIDILLLSTEMAREHQTKDPASQWVHLQAITHAPAASFVGSDIRHACQQAIDKGLVKIHSSFDNEENNFN